MKFDQIIFPEIVLGKRGNRKLTKDVQYILDYLTIKDNRFCLVDINKPEINLLKEPNGERFFKLLKNFSVEGSNKCYHITTDFLLELSKVELKEIPTDLLPDRFLAFISFPPNTLQDDLDYVHGAYVYIGPANKICLIDATQEEKYKEIVNEKIFWIAYVGHPKGNFSLNADNCYYASAIIALMKGSLKEIVNEYLYNKIRTEEDQLLINKRIRAYNTILNAVLYIHSQKPELIRTPAIHERSNKQWKEFKHREGLSSLCTLPVTMINWQYKRPVLHSVETAFVRSHPRWQRCGKDYSEIRLVWVREHERHYKNVIQETQ